MKSKASSRHPTKKSASPAPRLFLHGAAAGEKVPAAKFDADFVVTPEYRASLPDLMAAPHSIRGANVPVQQVGVSNFKLPLKFAGPGGPVVLEASVTGTVSLAANLKGINMSRIVRSFYDYRDRLITPEALRAILQGYRKNVGSLAARLRIAFSYPILQDSLRSGLAGYQYYRMVFEGRLEPDGGFRRFVEFEFLYSSTCPCSAELAEHARSVRGVFAVAHSQRSRARLRVEIADRRRLTPVDLQKICSQALRTETQVMVKREDEQAFAELNGAHLKFVEDAARLLHESLSADARIRDFRVTCLHEESLHSHDAVSVICKGLVGGMAPEIEGI